MSTEVNPYAPPKARVDDVSGAASEVETIRREHIKHEAAVRSIGTLYYIGGGLTLIAAFLFFLGGVGQPDVAAITLTIGALYLVLSAALLVVAYGIRRLKRGARIAGIVLSILGLIGFPIGTLINGYILYLLCSAKGRRIFAPDYAEIVAATPHIKYRTSIVVWIVLALVLVFVAALVLVGVMQ
jgi:hypothetical protein